MHIEAAKMLAFSEEEFVKALEWGSWWSAPCVNLLTYNQSFYNIPFAKTVNKIKISDFDVDVMKVSETLSLTTFYYRDVDLNPQKRGLLLKLLLILKSDT